MDILRFLLELKLNRKLVGIRRYIKPEIEYDRRSSIEKYCVCTAIDKCSKGNRIILNRESTLCFGGRYHLHMEAPPAWRNKFIVHEAKLFSKYNSSVSRMVKKYKPIKGVSYLFQPIKSNFQNYDLIIIVGYPAQIMRIIGLLAFSETKFKVETSFSGMCTGIIEEPLRWKTPTIHLIDPIARSLCDFKDEEMCIAISPRMMKSILVNFKKSICGSARPEYKREFPDPFTR